MNNYYDTRLLDEINQAELEKLGSEKSYNLMVNVESLMNTYNSRKQRNASLGIKDDLPLKALETIKNFASKSALLNGLVFDPYNSNSASYIAYDLARATAFIPPETPELSKELLTTAKSLFEKTYGISPRSQIQELTKVCRYTGDEGVATAFLDTTQDLFQNLDAKYGLYDDMLPALEHYKSIATLNPELASRCLDTANILASKIEEPYNKQPVIDIIDAVANNPNVSQELRDKAKDSKEKYQPTPKEQNDSQIDTSENTSATTPKPIDKQEASENTSTTTKKKVDKQKVLDFIKNSKAYAGGKKLFERIKTEFEKVLDENPKLFAAAGFVTMIAGFQTMQPYVAAAGAAIMIEGLHHFKNKMLEKRGIRQPSVGIASRPAGLQQNIKPQKGLKYGGR